MNERREPGFNESLEKATAGFKPQREHKPNRAPRAGRLTNFTEYFRTEHDVWVRTTTGVQVSLNFNLGHGDTTSFVIPATGDPYNLTQRFPWEAIKRSADIRHFVAGRAKPRLQLMTPGDAEAYYERKAAKKGTTVEVAMIEAEERREKMFSMQPVSGTTAQPIEDVPEAASPNDDNVVRTEEIVQSRVINLCHQVDPTIPANQRWDAKRLLEELEGIENTLSVDDLQYVVGHGRYRSIIRWADIRLKDKLTSDDAGSETSILEDDIPEDRITLG